MKLIGLKRQLEREKYLAIFKEIMADRETGFPAEYDRITPRQLADSCYRMATGESPVIGNRDRYDYLLLVDPVKTKKVLKSLAEDMLINYGSRPHPDPAKAKIEGYWPVEES